MEKRMLELNAEETRELLKNVERVDKLRTPESDAELLRKAEIILGNRSSMVEQSLDKGQVVGSNPADCIESLQLSGKAAGF